MDIYIYIYPLYKPCAMMVDEEGIEVRVRINYDLSMTWRMFEILKVAAEFEPINTRYGFSLAQSTSRTIRGRVSARTPTTVAANQRTIWISPRPMNVKNNLRSGFLSVAREPRLESIPNSDITFENLKATAQLVQIDIHRWT